MAAIAKLFVDIGANTQKFDRGLRNVDRNLHNTEKRASAFTTALGTGFGILGAKAVSSLVSFGKSVIETGKQFNILEENSTLAFETMLGSAEKAKMFLDDLKQFAEKTPFELPGLIASSQKLKAFGFETSQILPMLTNIGDAVAGLGGSPELLNRITIALGQIKAKGRIQAQEMLQLTEAGIPAWEILAKKIGVSIPEAMKLSEKGAIEANMAISGILEGLEERFGGLMSKQAKSYSGIMSNISDLNRRLFAQLQKPWFDVAKRGLESLLTLMQSPAFGAFFETLVKWSTKLANTFGKIQGFLMNGLISFVSMFSSETKKIDSSNIDKASKAFETLHWVLGDMENKRFKFLSNFTPKEALTSIVGFTKSLLNGQEAMDYWLTHSPRLFVPFMKGVKTLYNVIAGGGVQKTFSNITQVFKGLGNTLLKLVRPFKEALGGLFDQLAVAKNLGFSDLFKAVFSALGKALGEVLNTIKTDFWPSIKKGFSWLWETMKTMFFSIDWSSVWESLKSAFSGLIAWIQNIDYQSLWETIKSAFSGIVTFVSNIDWRGIGEAIKTGVQAIFSFIGSIEWGKIFSGLWDIVKSVGSFFIELITPPLSMAWNWLSSWFTDSSKRQQLSEGFKSLWDWIKSWGSWLWETIQPSLSSWWSSLKSYVENLDIQGLTSEWREKFNAWADDLWKGENGLYSKLDSWYRNFFAYLETNFPNIAKALSNLVTNWSSAFFEIQKLNKDFNSSLDISFTGAISEIVEFAASIGRGVANIVRILKAFKDGDWSTVWNELKFTVNDFWGWINTQFTFSDAWTPIFEGAKNLGSGIKTYFMSGLDGFRQGFEDFVIKPIMSAINQMVRALNSTLSLGSIFGVAPPQMSLPFPGYAKGGITKPGLALVGEKGPELVNFSGGERVLSNSATNSLNNVSSSKRIDVYVHNESKQPLDRSMVRELALMLQKELNLQGSRVAFAS